MPYIALVGVITLLLLEFTGAIPQSSVGGPMTIALVFFIAALAVGIREAWLHKRGVLGWIVSIFVALVGAYVAAEIGSFIVGSMLTLMQFEGSLAASRHPLLYVSLAGMLLFTMLGSWTALRLVDRMRGALSARRSASSGT